MVVNPPSIASMTIDKDGPYPIQAMDFESTVAGAHLDGGKYSLCRCGYSKNKPFCGYSHAENNWTDIDSEPVGAA